MSIEAQRIALVTDSTCDIPRELARELNIIIVPQILIWGTEELRDNVDITPTEFYARLPADPAHPTTSQPVPSTFALLFEELKGSGTEVIVAIMLSEQLSGTLTSVRQAAEMVSGIPIHILDSKSASMGLGFQVLAAARARQAGATAEEMLAAARAVTERVHLYLSVETLEYLHRGGRIGGAARLVGTALQLKPMLMVDTQSGQVEPVERTRTRRKALVRLYSVFREQVDPERPAHVAVLSGGVPEEAEAFAERVREDFNLVELIVTNTSPVIGVHTGPGAIGLAGYNEPA